MLVIEGVSLGLKSILHLASSDEDEPVLEKN